MTEKSNKNVENKKKNDDERKPSYILFVLGTLMCLALGFLFSRAGDAPVGTVQAAIFAVTAVFGAWLGHFIISRIYPLQIEKNATAWVCGILTIVIGLAIYGFWGFLVGESFTPVLKYLYIATVAFWLIVMIIRGIKSASLPVFILSSLIAGGLCYLIVTHVPGFVSKDAAMSEGVNLLMSVLGAIIGSIAGSIFRCSEVNVRMPGLGKKAREGYVPVSMYMDERKKYRQKTELD